MRFVIETALLDQLRAWRTKRGVDDIERAHDAMATDAEACQSIVVGSKKMKIESLLDLLPPRPSDSHTCARCHGERYGAAFPELPEVMRFACTTCNGLGWTT